MSSFVDKTVLVTGGTRGIGRGIVHHFAKQGARVVFTGRDAEQGHNVQQEMNKEQLEVTFVEGDVTDPDFNQGLIQKTIKLYGKLDILIPNAGMLGLGSVTETTLDLWHQTINTNLNGVFYLLKYGIPELQKQEGGTIVITGSIAAHKGFPNHAAYCASKGALNALVRQIANDYGPEIRINLIEPGPVETELFEASAVAFPNPDTVIDEVAPDLPLKRLGTPQDIAKAVAFLAGDESSWITGSVLRIDGGALSKG